MIYCPRNFKEISYEIANVFFRINSHRSTQRIYRRHFQRNCGWNEKKKVIDDLGILRNGRFLKKFSNTVPKKLLKELQKAMLKKLTIKKALLKNFSKEFPKVSEEISEGFPNGIVLEISEGIVEGILSYC